MGMCCLKGDYSGLDNEISLYDKTLPKIPSTCRRIKDLTESEKNQLIALFECFDTSKEGTLGSNEIKDGLTTFGKSPSNKSVQRILKQMHLSQAPVNRVEFKGFALGIISRRSLLYDFLYDGYDTREEMEKEIRDEEKRGRGWGRFGV